MATPTVDMKRLLPSVYRLNDDDLGGSLQALLDVLAAQGDALKLNVDQMWDDFFVETCADWVVPYIGDLVANRPLQGVALRNRADVAKTIHYRRRKGTLPMLEQMAASVTGWGIHAVAAFEVLSWTQNLNHLRMTPAPIKQRDDPDDIDALAFDRVGTVNLRNGESLARLNTAFDQIAHSVDVRKSQTATISSPPPAELVDRGVDQDQGWYGIRNVLFFIWRISSFKLTRATARRSSVAPDGFHFSSIGSPAPLFAPKGAVHDDADPITESEVPGPIRPAAFYYKPAQYYPNAFEIVAVRGGLEAAIAPGVLVCRNLSNWEAPPKDVVAVDVRLGRIRFADGQGPDSVKVTYSYGACAPIGGGAYERRGRTIGGVADTIAQPRVSGWSLYVVGDQPVNAKAVTDAIALWNADGNPNAVIEIQNSGTYSGDLAITAVQTTLIIQAQNGQRPTILGNVAVTGTVDAGLVCFDGLLVAGQLTVSSHLGRLSLAHCTLVPGLDLDDAGDRTNPGQPSILIGPDKTELELAIDHCVVGGLRLAGGMKKITVSDSIIDAGSSTNTPALLSGPISNLPGQAGSFEITIGRQGPYTAQITSWPGAGATLNQAAAALQQAIRASHPTVAFAGAAVFTTDKKRLAIVPGGPGAVRIGRSGADTTASSFLLDAASSTLTTAIVGEQVNAIPDFSAGPRLLTASLGANSWPVAVAPPNTNTLAGVARSLQAGLRAAAGGTLPNITVRVVDGHLLVLSADAAPLPVLRAANADALAYLLGVTTARQALVALDQGAPFGPETDLLRTTVVGECNVKQLYASEVIFSERVRSERTQTGCVRFSYVPPGSTTPRTFHCQPKSGASASLTDLLLPVFKSLHFGEPAYGQLDLVCAAEIRTGAEDASEMGVYCSLNQPQRESSLLLRLQEYLPVGRQPGLIYVT